jgi:uncharacterized membrane protein YoaT (DUF817 family)
MQIIKLILRESWLFGLKQAWACLFGGAFLALILGTRFWYPAGAWIARYDFLVFAALGIQVALLLLKLESFSEAIVIGVFHVVGTVMELYKTAIGSWAYPDAGTLKIGLVPLFSGFMYAAVGSYIARVSRLLDFRYSHYPSKCSTILLATLIYVNFYTNHFLWDIRLALFVAIGVLFWRTQIYFVIDREPRSMPLLLGFFLVSFFIWVAENIGSFSHIWIYPSQLRGFTLVSANKIGAWYLLMIVSFVQVSLVHRPVMFRRRRVNPVVAGAGPTAG